MIYILTTTCIKHIYYYYWCIISIQAKCGCFLVRSIRSGANFDPLLHGLVVLFSHDAFESCVFIFTTQNVGIKAIKDIGISQCFTWLFILTYLSLYLMFCEYFWLLLHIHARAYSTHMHPHPKYPQLILNSVNLKWNNNVHYLPGNIVG